MSSPAETENTAEGRSGRQATGGNPPRGFLDGRRIIWLFLAAGAIHSVVPAMMLAVWGRGGMVPGIAILLFTLMAVGWLVVLWGLVAVGAASRRPGVRAVILLLLLLPYPMEISLFGDGVAAIPRLLDDPKTGRGFFDTQVDRDLGGAIWACDRRNRNDGAVCDLDKIATLTAKTDTSKVSSHSVSLMWWAITNGAEPDVLRIVLRGGTPPADVSSWLLTEACCDSSDLPLLHAALDGGVDPNTRRQVGDPFWFNTIHWLEALTIYLDAGARIDELDREGYTALMRTILYHQYEAAELLLARGAVEERIAPDGTTMAALVAAIQPEDVAKLPPAVRALADRHRPH
jgi:hypothetical protein